jgi:uncharacterized protein (UPF0332 family)
MKRKFEKLRARLQGRPRQADIRRAISAAYYGVFHAVIAKAVDQFVGAINRDKAHYGLAYRSVSHSRLREVCNAIQKPTPPGKYRPYAPIAGFGPDVIALADAIEALQEKRHSADYDIMIRMNRSDAAVAIATVRAALARLDKTPQQEQLAFLGLLLFSPRCYAQTDRLSPASRP